jgi:hypothetical protein
MVHACCECDALDDDRYSNIVFMNPEWVLCCAGSTKGSTEIPSNTRHQALTQDGRTSCFGCKHLTVQCPELALHRLVKMIRSIPCSATGRLRLLEAVWMDRSFSFPVRDCVGRPDSALVGEAIFNFVSLFYSKDDRFLFIP